MDLYTIYRTNGLYSKTKVGGAASWEKAKAFLAEIGEVLDFEIDADNAGFADAAVSPNGRDIIIYEVKEAVSGYNPYGLWGNL